MIRVEQLGEVPNMVQEEEEFHHKMFMEVVHNE